MEQGETPFDFTTALHSYYGVSHVSKATIEGPFNGATYVDKTQNPPTEAPATSNAWPVNAFLEGVFPNLTGPVALADAGRKTRTTIVHSRGFNDYILWNPHGNGE